MTDIYKTPDAELSNQQVSGDYGSLEKGIAGDYEFSIGDTLSEAWEKTNGAKLTFNLAFFLYFLVAIGVMVVAQFILIPFIPSEPGADTSLFMIVWIGQQVIINLILMPIVMGMFLLGLRRAVDAPVNATSIFGYYNKALTLLLTLIIMYVMLTIGFVLLVIPGIYLSIAYILAMPLVVEKNLSPWQALEASRKAISKNWFTVFGFMIVMGLILFVSALPLGIGMIWTMPMLMIAYGIMYRNIFGCETETVG